MIVKENASLIMFSFLDSSRGEPNSQISLSKDCEDGDTDDSLGGGAAIRETNNTDREWPRKESLKSAAGRFFGLMRPKLTFLAISNLHLHSIHMVEFGTDLQAYDATRVNPGGKPECFLQETCDFGGDLLSSKTLSPSMKPELQRNCLRTIC